MKIDKVEKLMRGNKREAEGVLVCMIDGQERHVPEDNDNIHYQEIKKMERKGEIIITERDLEKDIVAEPQPI